MKAAAAAEWARRANEVEGQKKAAAGKKVGKPQGTVVTAVSPAILIGAEAAKLEWAELAPYAQHPFAVVLLWLVPLRWSV